MRRTMISDSDGDDECRYVISFDFGKVDNNFILLEDTLMEKVYWRRYSHPEGQVSLTTRGSGISNAIKDLFEEVSPIGWQEKILNDSRVIIESQKCLDPKEFFGVPYVLGFFGLTKSVVTVNSLRFSTGDTKHNKLLSVIEFIRRAPDHFQSEFERMVSLGQKPDEFTDCWNLMNIVPMSGKSILDASAVIAFKKEYASWIMERVSKGQYLSKLAGKILMGGWKCKDLPKLDDKMRIQVTS